MALTTNQKDALNLLALGETAVANKNGAFHTSLTFRPINKRVLDTLRDRGLVDSVGVTAQSPKYYVGVYAITLAGREELGAPLSGDKNTDDLVKASGMTLRYIQKKTTQRFIWGIRQTQGRGIMYTSGMIAHIVRNFNRFRGTKPDRKPGDELVAKQNESYVVLGLRKKDQELRTFSAPNTARFEARKNANYVAAGSTFKMGCENGEVEVINIEPVLPHSFYATFQVGEEVKLVELSELTW